MTANLGRAATPSAGLLKALPAVAGNPASLHEELPSSIACVHTGTQPYLVCAEISKNTTEDLLAAHWPALVNRLGAVLERHTAVMRQDEDLRPHHVMNLSAGYELREGPHPDPSRACVELFLDPYTYSAEQLCADACRIGDEVRRSLSPAATAPGAVDLATPIQPNVAQLFAESACDERGVS